MEQNITITKNQWNNLKKIATEIGKLAEELTRTKSISSCDLEKHSNNLWKQINQIDGIEW